MKIPKTLKTIFIPGQRLSQRAIFAGAWMVPWRLAGRGLSIVRIIILARLLTPEAFGIVSIALIVKELLNNLTQFGFGEALIQRKGDIKDYLDTLWIMQVVRGLVLGGILFGIAQFAANYFNAPEAKAIIQVMAITLVVSGFFSSGIIYFYKELQIQKRFIWDLSGDLTEIAVTVSMAFVLRNAWAVVIGAVTSSIVFMIVSFIMTAYRPKLRFEIGKAKELFSFGWWALLYSIITYIFINFDTIFVGKILGVVVLGIYTIADKVGNLISVEIGLISNAIVFPVYSKLQDNNAMLRLAFFTSIEGIALITFPIAVAVFVLAPDFTPIVFGQQWIKAVPPMQILCIAAAIFSLISTGGSLFYAVNKPRKRFIIMLVASFIMVALLYPLSKEFGMVGAASAVLAGNIGGLLFQTWASAEILKSGIKDLLRPFISPVIVSLVLGITLTLTKQVFAQIKITELIMVICSGVAIYIVCSFLLWRLFKSGPVQVLNVFRDRK
jgi:O-antigen/teichoic acid export membrane protein